MRKKLSLLRQLDSDIDDVIKEATLFIRDCYGFQQESMTKFRISPGAQKKSKARKSAPSLQSLHPKDATMEIDPPAVDPTLYGWRRDKLNKVLVPIG